MRDVVVELDQIRRSIEERKARVDETERNARWNLLDLAALCEPLPPIPWVCEGLGLAPGAPSLIAGYGYSRKTMALQSLAVSVAAGKPVWGVYGARSGRVIHLDYEQGRRVTQERYQRLARGMGCELQDLPAGSLRVASMPRVYLDEAGIEDELVRLCTAVTVAIVDSLRAAFPHADENSSEVRNYLDILGRVSERTGCAFLVIHHARKPTRDDAGGTTYAIRGSSALFDACQSVYVFAGEKDAPTVVHHQKDRVRGVTVSDFGLTSEDIDGRVGLRVLHMEAEQLARDSARVEASRTRRRLETAKEAVRDLIARSGGTWTGNRDAMRALLRLDANALAAALAELTNDGSVTRSGAYHLPVWSTPTGSVLVQG